MLQYKDFYFSRFLLKNLLLVYVMMAIIRAILYGYNRAAFVDITWGELSYIFVAALRFDTVSICYVHSLFILWHLMPTNWRASKLHQHIGVGIWTGANMAMAMVEFGDVGYYPYAFRRVTRTDFEMQQDFFAMLPTFFKEFWWMGLLAVIGGIIFYRYYRYTRQAVFTAGSGRKYWIGQWAILLVAATLTVIGMRGGLQPRPITSTTAMHYVSNICYAALPCNATLNVIHSAEQRTLQNVQYFDSLALQQYQPIHFYPAPSDTTPKRRYNVVVIIVESFGKEYISYFNKNLPVQTPFMDSLCARGLLFTQAHANGTRSTQGVVAVTSGLPSLMQDPFMFSAFAQNRLGAMSNYLSRTDYNSAFFHGGQNGTMNFDSYSKTIGYQHYHGKNEYSAFYPDSAQVNFDGAWGIWDAPFLRYTVKQLNQLDTPFLATYFTITPHHPYLVPEEIRQKYPDEQPLFQAIRYTDECLATFFAAAQKEPWYDNTLFIITADHIGAAISPAAGVRPMRYQIPIIFYHPTDTNFQRRQSDQLAQQIDILPTALRYLGYSQPFYAFGHDLLQPQPFENFSYTFDNGLYQIMDTSHALIFDGDSSLALFDYRRDTFLINNYKAALPDKVKYLENQLKARIQAHHQGYINNKLPH
jgi:phosphoglycerol transferase MdoB-like AlkP superfamily enzyme